jgi:hypothetical protein
MSCFENYAAGEGAFGKLKAFCYNPAKLPCHPSRRVLHSRLKVAGQFKLDAQLHFLETGVQVRRLCLQRFPRLTHATPKPEPAHPESHSWIQTKNSSTTDAHR